VNIKKNKKFDAYLSLKLKQKKKKEKNQNNFTRNMEMNED
jgi:hypothetical protein